MTDYIATRWYRAPEVLLGSAYYSSPIDIWSFGCTLAEMHLGYPIFPGSSTLDQLSKILHLTGLPTEETLEAIGSPLTYKMFKNLFIAEHKRDF